MLLLLPSKSTRDDSAHDALGIGDVAFDLGVFFNEVRYNSTGTRSIITRKVKKLIKIASLLFACWCAKCYSIELLQKRPDRVLYFKSSHAHTEPISKAGVS